MRERERQHLFAVEHAAKNGTRVSRHHFICSDGEPFAAIATGEAGAFCVLNAERPGISVSVFEGPIDCTIESEIARRLHQGDVLVSAAWTALYGKGAR